MSLLGAASRKSWCLGVTVHYRPHVKYIGCQVKSMSDTLQTLACSVNIKVINHQKTTTTMRSDKKEQIISGSTTTVGGRGGMLKK